MRSPKRFDTVDGPRWKVRYRRSGAQTSQTFPTEAEALKFCIDLDEYGAGRAEQLLYDRLAAGEDSTIPSLDEWVRTYLDLLEALPGTREKYRRNYTHHISPRVGSLPITHIERDDAIRLVRHLSEEKQLSDKTVRNVFSILAAAMDSAHKRGTIPANPCAEVRMPNRTAHLRPESTYLTQTEFARLRAAFHQHFIPLLDFAIGTGARWGECAALQVRDVDYRAGTVRINKAVKSGGTGPTDVGPPKSVNSIRTVALPPELPPSLVPATEGKAPDDLVFTMPRGGPLLHRTFTTRHWIRACEKAGLVSPRPTFHWLRHSHASWLIQQGVDPTLISRRLGHAGIQITIDTYGHLAPGAQAQAAEVAGRVFRALDT